MIRIRGIAVAAALSAVSTLACGDSEPDAADLPDAAAPCVPATCADLGVDCGEVADGCGAQLDCGGCDDPATCGGGGIANTCGIPCTSVGVIFFDLGETLVVPDGAGRFENRPGAAALIADLKAIGMRVGVITNTPGGFTEEDLRALLVDPGLLDEFEVVLLSSQAVALPKPDPAIFAEAHGLLTDPPPIEESAFVTEELEDLADREQAPTRGARAAGMVGVHLSAAAPSPLADYTVPPDQMADIATLAETEWLPCGE